MQFVSFFYCVRVYGRNITSCKTGIIFWILLSTQSYTLKVSSDGKDYFERVKVDTRKRTGTTQLREASSGKDVGDTIYDFNRVSCVGIDLVGKILVVVKCSVFIVVGNLSLYPFGLSFHIFFLVPYLYIFLIN